MRVALICIDKPNSLEVRMANRPAHVEHLNASGIVELAGPFLDAQGQMCGSMIVLSVDTIEQAQAWMAKMPIPKRGCSHRLTFANGKR